jgi:PAS domain S-box-containing protein
VEEETGKMDADMKQSVLIVDDEISNLKVLNQILSSEYDVLTAQSGQEALELVGEESPDLILLDVLMPDMSGFDVLRQLKAQEDTARIPVIFITGLDSDTDEEKGFLLGAADYIKKPFTDTIVRVRVHTQMQIIRQLSLTRDDLVRVSSIVESSPQFMLYISEKGNIEYINPAVSEVTGFSKEEFLARGLMLILKPEDLEQLFTEYLPGAIKHRKFSFQLNVVRKDGEIRVMLFSAFAATLTSGKIGMGLTAIDITDTNRLQQELLEAKEQAEVGFRQAVYYNQAKSDFLSRMSHEMRTPMNAIMGATSIVRTADDARRLILFDKIDAGSQQLLRIINDMLDMAKIDAGGFDLSEQPFLFHSAMEAIQSEIIPLAAEKEQIFEVKIDKEIPSLVVTDERRLRQALKNLLDNAVKFTPNRGKIELEAIRLPDLENRCVLHFCVRDNGIGISSEHQERLWVAFEQADNSITRAHGGTGLGLSITRHIVEKMGGNIAVESELGQGSVFAFTISVSYEENSEPDTPLHFDKLEGVHALIVDDVEINREILFSLLEDTGLILETAENGLEAVQRFTQNGYDLVLMDLHMPVMDGYEAARQIRAMNQSVRIVAVTADTGGAVVARCLEAGMNAHMGKPVEYNTLLKTIVRQLENE